MHYNLWRVPTVMLLNCSQHSRSRSSRASEMDACHVQGSLLGKRSGTGKVYKPNPAPVKWSPLCSNFCAHWQISCCWGWGVQEIHMFWVRFHILTFSLFWFPSCYRPGKATNMGRSGQQIWVRMRNKYGQGRASDVLNEIFHPCLEHFPISWWILHSHGITSERPPVLIQIFYR